MIVAETPPRGDRCGGAGPDRLRTAADRCSTGRGPRPDAPLLEPSWRITSRCRSHTGRACPEEAFAGRADCGRGGVAYASLCRFAARAARDTGDGGAVRRRSHGLGQHPDAARAADHPRELAARAGRADSRRRLRRRGRIRPEGHSVRGGHAGSLRGARARATGALAGGARREPHRSGTRARPDPSHRGGGDGRTDGSWRCATTCS